MSGGDEGERGVIAPDDGDWEAVDGAVDGAVGVGVLDFALGRKRESFVTRLSLGFVSTKSSSISMSAS